MFAACRLARLSAVEAQYAGLIVARRAHSMMLPSVWNCLTLSEARLG
jgi:hypothetical protein